ncbi:MAG TPA: hypothetical protein VF824_22595 [Thermoanaerobaculia bacterium]|jgi:hypothetical protein
MRSLAAAVLLALFCASSAAADEPITKPIRYTWMATSCKTWNCATAALVLAAGDKYTIAIPTGRAEEPWVILRRVEEGSVYIPDDEPYACEVFDTVDGATSRFGILPDCAGGLIMNVPDGRAVVTSLRKCDGGGKRRSVR